MAKKLKVNTKKKGTIWEIPMAAKKGHDNTAGMVQGLRQVKNKLPEAIRDAFPDI